jgi:hypothetical protein
LVSCPKDTAPREGHRLRWPKRFAAALLLPLVLVAATACPPQPPKPVGFGLMQFAGFTDSRTWDDPRALGVNRLFTWADLEPTEGQYDWSEFDVLIDVARAKGKRLSPRVYTNMDAWGQATPDWVFDAGAASYRSTPGSERQPVPMDPVFTEKFSRFLEAMASRYDGNPDIEFIQTNAGMGEFGEIIWAYPREYLPPGWSPEVQIETSKQWIDRWRALFPRTHLVLMENFIGENIAETVTAYAVDRGFYLQANDTYLPRESQAILAAYAHRTRIVLEVEHGGCQSAQGQAFDDMTATVFGYGFPVDYLMVCEQTFDDAARTQGAIDRLRKDDAIP